MNQQVRYGITGFGRFAEKAIAPAIRSTPNSRLVAVQNRTLKKAQQMAAEHDAPHAFQSVKEMVAHPEVDAIFIVSPNSLHCSETVLAAEAGKHVLCEKPMGLNESECKRMIDACKQNNVLLMVGHMIRLSPLVLRMKELVQSGNVGEVIHAASHFVYDGRLSTRTWLVDRQVAGGGPTFDVGVHCLDTLRFILNDEVDEVRGLLQPLPDANKTETSAHLLLRFAKGTMASVYSSYDSPVRESYLEILGTEARISALDFTVGGRTAELVVERRSASSSAERVIERIEVPNLYIEEVSRFSDCILDGHEVPLTGENGLMNQRTLDAAMNLQ